MRPEILYPLFAPVRSLRGVGPKLELKFQKIAGERAVDLLWLRPTSYIDRRVRPSIAAAPEGLVSTFAVDVLQHQPPKHPKQPYRVLCSDPSSLIALVYFQGQAEYLKRLLPEGARRLVSGKVERHDGMLQITHPDYVVAPDTSAEIPAVEPVYPLTEGLSNKMVSKAARGALAAAPALPEWQDAAWREREALPGWREALTSMHAPEALDEALFERARRRLAFDELMTNQLALLMIRARMKKAAGRALKGDGRLRSRLLEALPYALTGAQTRTIREIEADLASGERMLRLLQGDVGAGKTVVALAALLVAVECGAQGAMMAPTEILARQHLATMRPLCEAIGVRVALLTGREKGKARDEILAALESGSLHVLIGTHALFSEEVAFRDLALAVVDEQHKFGVHQRLALAAKGGRAAHVLVMTATPIPRTLTMAAYGDMDVSRLDERPPGRKPVATRVIPLSRLDEVEDAIGRAIEKGERAYWVCPLVEQNIKLDVAAAETRFRDLRARFGERVALVHGQMKATEKDAAMAAFKEGAASILVSTTVIEVGVDVPEATIMVIEHAERFGLAQLHQLRGRVGRGGRAGSCLLLYQDDPPPGETARARLKIMRETDDGFVIAEEDLRLRGAGDVLGTKQAGLPEFRFADLETDGRLLEAARDDARLVLARDPDLTSPRGQALRVALYLYERDEAARLLRSA